jgi:DNA polymerase-3 subunit delta
MAPPRKKAANTGRAKLDANTRIAVLHGKEQMLKRQYLTQLREALEKAHGEIETFSFDGKTADLAEVLDELRGYSLMQCYKLVVVEDADTFVKNHRQAMERYAQQPVDHATLLLRADTWNKGKLDDHIAAVGSVIACKEVGEAQAAEWLIDRAKAQHGRLLEKPAAQTMVDRLGPNLSRLDSELGKIALLGEANEPINKDHVVELVGRGSEEQAWAAQESLLQALQTGSTEQAVRTVRELIELANQPEALVMYFVADLWRKLTVASMLRSEGWADKDLFKELRIFGPRQRMISNVLRRYDRAALQHVFDRALQLDARAKSGLGEPMRNLERFCVSLPQLTR